MTDLALATEAYQATLEHLRASEDDELSEQLEEDLARARVELEAAFLRHHLNQWGQREAG